ncbi:hypothetical protein Vi05172_g12756 [Venturia inaequalis]|nr:hypothetical protein Vi05172_g12756 [Venturia inaequalis]
MFVLRWLQAGCVQFLGGGDGLCTWLNHKVQNGTWSALSKKDSHRQAWSAERVGLRREETDHCPHEEGDAKTRFISSQAMAALGLGSGSKQ